MEDIMLYTSGIRASEQIRFIDYNIEMEDRFEVCGVGMVEDPGTCDEASSSGGGMDGGGSDGGGTSGGSGSGETGGFGDTEEDNGWDRQESSTELSDSGTDDNKGGCSHVGRSSTGLGWSLLVGMMALFGRRRQTAA